MPELIPAGSTCYYERLTVMSDDLLREKIQELPPMLAERIQYLTGEVPAQTRGKTVIIVEPGFTARPASVHANDDPGWYDERMRFVVSILNAEGRMIRQDSIAIALKKRTAGRYVQRLDMEVETAMERFLIRNVLDRRIRPLLEESASLRGASAFA